ncbi:MAG TPA: acetate--CoA ligase [Miltoncostaeaceae bacterium]|jgi:acetyl-CoA synthetase|nr:acetate--CoA ligase [Miltoncostaeaceae bacterium]
MSSDGPTITSLELEDRRFPPPAEFAAQANVTEEMYERAAADPEAFWLAQAKELLSWETEPAQGVDRSNAPFFTWFADGTLNASVQCLDRHLATRGDQVAFHWEGEPSDERQAITYRDLYERVCRLTNGLRERGVGKGDRVAIYLGMIPEIVVAMLACARIGAPHTVIFGGFSPSSVRDRVLDCGVTAVITGDGAWRGGKLVPLKANVDAALEDVPDVHTCVVVRRTENEIGWVDGRDVWYHDLVEGRPAEAEPEIVGAEHPLYILYTSGSTGKPKGILHTTAGYLTGCAATHRWVFDLKDDDVYWCAADVGWVTGHSYIVYAPLTNGATSVLYEGAPGTPDKDRWWEIIARYGVSILYCAPTAIRTFMKWGVEYPQRHDMSSLRLLGSVGEPINPEAWIWYRENIGGGRCPVVDTWWQTETGAIMISPLPGVTTLKPGSATRPLPGITADVVDANGQSVPLGSGGYLVLTEPWPSMLRTLYGDDDRFIQTYWSEYEGMYLAGDGARRDDDGDYWLLGRIDDVMNVSGHRLSTIEIESALVDHPKVAEAAVVGRSDETTGQAIAAFVTLRGGVVGDQDIIAELRQHVATKIGGIARPKSIVLTDDLPKTRSGKIMRRLLRDISENRQLGDVTTLANEDVVSDIAKEAAEARAANKEE